MTKSVSMQNFDTKFSPGSKTALSDEKRLEFSNLTSNYYKSISYNTFKAIEIIGKQWTKWNMPDEISYISKNKEICIISDENLLSDICRYLKSHHQSGSLPYIHIEGKDYIECYEEPSNSQIMAYLNENLHLYDIYSLDGALLHRKEPVNDENYQIHNFLNHKTVTEMKNIELELDSEKNIFIVGKKIILSKTHFPIKVKTEDKEGRKIKRVISLRDKNGCVKMNIS